MVNPLINDGHLIGFWPLHEPSGAAMFHNYSPHTAGKPSGISFDLKVHIGLPTTSSDEERSIWPGTTQEVLLGTSGVPHTNAFKAQGNHLLSAGAGEHQKMLILGDGGQNTRTQLYTPRVAQSGFTAGFWVSPQSNGRLDRNNPRNHAKAHALLGIADLDVGWYMGVSGSLTQAAQNVPVDTFAVSSWGQPNNPSGLAAFVINLNGSNATTTAGNANHRNVPIESGCFTHLTMTYRFISDDGATNTHQIVLYRNGRVAASGSFTGVADANAPVAGSASYNIRTLCIGGSVEETNAVDRYRNATGWGHLMSGVYYFNRVLHEGEILAMHNAGGLQPFEGVYPLDSKEVAIDDSKMIAYLPFWGPGYPDASFNRWPGICDFDEGDEARFVTTPGPFGRGGLHAFGAAERVGIGFTSGAMQSLADSRSFTIAGWFSPEDDAHDFDQNMLFSLGTVGTAFTTVPTEASMGFYVNTDPLANNVRYVARFFPIGSHNNFVAALSGADVNLFSQTAAHVGMIYDDQTKGVALYVNGELQQSGTLVHSLADQVSRLVGSGFPLVFLNGVQTTMSNDPYMIAGGANNASSDFVVIGRPLLDAEMRFLAQSGIRSTHLLRTVHDPRLFGYWPCNSLDAQAMIIPDTARVWNSTPANLVRGTNDGTWDNIQLTDNQGPWYRRDEFSRRYAIPPELASELPLGITSGVWSVNGGSPGVDYIDAEVRRSSLANFAQRVRPFTDSRTDTPVTPYSYAISFEVTPSGNIRAVTPGALFAATPTAGFRHNTVLHVQANDSSTANSAFYSYLTNNAHVVGQNPGSSGVTIVFEGRDTNAAANFTQIASGNLPFGVPSRVLLHAQYTSPHYYADAANSVLDVSLYINGVKAYSRFVSATTSRMWSTSEVANAGQHLLHFGGLIQGEDTTPANHIGDGEAGLGEIYLRNIFILKGLLSGDDIGFFATSGIVDSPAFAGYTNEQVTTQVTTNHTNLQGYYRFAGGVSGELDLSLKHNDLVPLARIFETNNPPLFNTRVNPALALRYLPGPLLLSDLGVQASGITYEGTEFTSAVVAPPFVASGQVFTRPDTGFAIGFWYAKRDAATAATSYNNIISFGNVPDDINIAVNIIDLNHSWAIIWAPTHNISMYISQSGTGSMYLDPDTANAALSGTIVCGANTNYSAGVQGTSFLGDYRRGFMTPGHNDSWNHVLWSYDALSRIVTCYMNGTQVDQKFVSSGVNLPLDPAARLISMLVPQTGVWNWNSNDNRADINSILTDVCYFDAPITAAEARYIAFNGIDAAVGTVASGLIGGFIRGQDTGSGMIGGFTRGQDTGSGMIGGYFPASTAMSGMIGGYISGVIFSEGYIGGYLRGIDFGSGMIGGFLHGLDRASGVVAGYIQGINTVSGIVGGFLTGAIQASGHIGGFITGSNVASGIVGGFILGGLENGLVEFDSSFTVEVMSAKDFDAQLELMKTGFADFDSKIVIFQDEAIPDVRIVIPDMTVSGLMPPFNQYFIGFASGRQGKTIEQVRWTFGDFTPSQTVDASGSVFYPIQHRYASSGFYIAKFEAIDSNGMHSSAIRYINAASGIDPVIISLSGVPRSGDTALIVDFSTVIDILPPGVAIVAKLLNFDDGQSTISINPTHSYTEPGLFKPIWCVRDSRGVVWCDSLEAGNDFLRSGGA